MKNIIFLVLLIAAHATPVFANPTQTGVTGLLNVPTADTLDSGNICVGIWGNISKSSNQSSIILPATLTLGIGSFWEAYATYPNLLFNGQEDYSGRGTADVGTKIRFLGKRDSKLKLAADIFVNRHVSEDFALDGILDVGGRLVASVKIDRIGIHLYGGYLNSGDKTVSDNELLYGGGLEYLASPRTKVILEIFGKSAANPFSISASNPPVEGSLGLQYYISPHLTLNLAGGIGLTSTSPDWRALIGISTCQGVGTYIKALPTLVSEGDDKGKKRETVKPVKIIPLTSLIKFTAPIMVASKIEVPVEPDKEEIVIKPYGQIVIPSQPVTSPVVLPLLPQEIKMTRIESEVSVQPKTEIVTDLTPADESNLEGVTSLYGIEVMGDTVEISTVKTVQLPEKMTVYRKFRFPDIMFEFNQAELSKEVIKALSEVAEQTRSDKKWAYLRIDGHTDSLGSVNYNMDLSIKRAIAVASYLILHEGVDPSRVFVKGMGKSKLIADNVTTEGRRMNRRFEILFLVPKVK